MVDKTSKELKLLERILEFELCLDAPRYSLPFSENEQRIKWN